MKRFLQSVMLIFAAVLSVYGQNVSNKTDNEEYVDSTLTHSLDEVVVKAKRMYMSVNKVSYTPTKQQCNSSANGTMLLQQLAIPQLKVNALSGDVTTSAGDPISFFINGVPATSNDVNDLNTRDVLKVEVLDYPSDPKYRNAEHVVNYVLQKYEYGGYTKLMTSDMLLNGILTTNVVNSKLVYKRMTYDVRVGHKYSNDSHSGSEKTQLFNVPGYGEVAPTGITRTSKLESSKYIMNRPTASFRALYQDDKLTYSSQLDWSYKGVRTNYQSGSLMYTPDIFSANQWNINNPTRQNTLNWGNDLYKELPKQWTLSAMFYLSYDHMNQSQFMQEQDVNIRDLIAKEDIWETQSMIRLSKKFGSKHNLSLAASSITYKSDIDYLGLENDFNHVSQLTLTSGAIYSFMPSSKLYTRLGLHATYYHSSTTSTDETKLYPTIVFNVTWMPHERHRFSAVFDYRKSTPTGSQTNAVLLQTDQLQWSQGNPNLKSYNQMITQLSYTWNPSQYINISPIATWVNYRNFLTDTYTLTDNGQGVLVKPENCGNYNNVWATINFTAYALNRKLVLSANPSISYHKFTGFYDINHTGVDANINGTYYFGKYYVGASYQTPKKYFNQGDPLKLETRSTYWLMAGWGNSSWTVYGMLINPFRSHWRTNVSSIETPVYKMNKTTIDTNDHRRVNITVVYTFGYGKKVNRGNDLQESTDADSSIR
jgi:hypothetical protein